ncbi:MAG: Rrf2 family transcriptional regulator [Verrucomicrobiota bacterium]
MNLSKRGEYAVRVLLDLAMATSRGRHLVPLTALVESQKIPAPFLEQILLSLRQAGYLTSVRGKYGGYSLAKQASEVHLGEVIRFLEGPLVSTGCVNAGGTTKCSCPDPQHCGLRLLMTQVQGALSGVLDQLTLESLAGTTLAGFLKDGVLPAVLQQGEVKKKSKRGGGGESEPEYWI